jgi:hypothetical protein
MLKQGSFTAEGDLTYITPVDPSGWPVRFYVLLGTTNPGIRTHHSPFSSISLTALIRQPVHLELAHIYLQSFC